MEQKGQDGGESHLRRKRKFMRVLGLAFGFGMAIIMLSLVWNHGGIGWWLYVIGLCALGGWAFGFLMWHAIGKQWPAVPKGNPASEVEPGQQDENRSNVGSGSD